MKVLVTGISGYLASVVTPRLLGDDEVEEVRGVDLQYPQSIDTTNSKLVFIKKDVRALDIVDSFSGIDVLFHFAFIVTPNVPYDEIDSINIEGSKNIFNAAAKAGVKHILYTSSIAAYGADPTHKLPLKEDSPLKPNEDWYYSRAKGAVERFLNEFEQKYPDIKVTRFRPAIFLGPNIDNQFGTLLRSPVIMDLGYDAKIEWVWDQDVADAIYLAFEKGKTGIYNLGGENPLTWKEIAEVTGKETVDIDLNSESGRELFSQLLTAMDRGFVEWLDKPVKYPILVDSSKARKELGWQPKYDSAGAIKAFLSLEAETDGQTTSNR